LIYKSLAIEIILTFMTLALLSFHFEFVYFKLVRFDLIYFKSVYFKSMALEIT